MRIRNGIIAYELQSVLRAGDTSYETEQTFHDQTKHDLGYGLLLKRYTNTVTDATEQQIQQAADDSIPAVWPLFWSFRIMVGCGFIYVVCLLARLSYKPTVKTSLKSLGY